MSLHETNPGKFTVQVAKSDPLGEKPLRLCRRIEGRKAAEDQERVFRAEANEWASKRALMKQAQDRGIQFVYPSIPSSSTGFADFLEQVYLPWARVHHDPRTLAARAGTMMILAQDLGNVALADVENRTNDLVVRWREEGCRRTVDIDRLGRVLNRKPRPISDAGINERLKILRAILGHAHSEAKILQFRPRISLVKIKRAAPGASTMVRYFTVEERVRMLKYSIKGVEDVFLIGVLTGMRPAEIFHMLVGWVDFRQNKIFVQASACPHCPGGKWIPKTGSYRGIDIAPDLLPVLRRLVHKKADTAQVLENNHGRPYIALPGSNGRFLRTMKRAGLDRKGLSAYSMRHTFAADLITKGVSISEVAALLGNSPRTVELHYHALIPGKTAEAVKLLKAAKPWPDTPAAKPATKAVGNAGEATVTAIDEHAA